MDSNEQCGKLQSHDFTVTCLCLDQKERFLYSGTSEGDLVFWEIQKDAPYSFSVLYHFYDHVGAITALALNDNLRVVASAGADHNIHIYNMYNGEFYRTISHPTGQEIQQVSEQPGGELARSVGGALRFVAAFHLFTLHI